MDKRTITYDNTTILEYKDPIFFDCKTDILDMVANNKRLMNQIIVGSELDKTIHLIFQDIPEHAYYDLKIIEADIVPGQLDTGYLLHMEKLGYRLVTFLPSYKSGSVYAIHGDYYFERYYPFNEKEIFEAVRSIEYTVDDYFDKRCKIIYSKCNSNYEYFKHEMGTYYFSRGKDIFGIDTKEDTVNRMYDIYIGKEFYSNVLGCCSANYLFGYSIVSQYEAAKHLIEQNSEDIKKYDIKPMNNMVTFFEACSLYSLYPDISVQRYLYEVVREHVYMHSFYECLDDGIIKK